MVSEGSSAKKLYSFINGKRCESNGVSGLKREEMAYLIVTQKRTPPSLMNNEQFGSAFTREDLNAMPLMSGSQFPKMRDPLPLTTKEY